MQRFSDKSVDRDRRVLVVDDDDSIRVAFVETLRDAGYDVAEAWSTTQAMRLLLSYRPDVVVLDLVLPDGHGIEIGRAMRAIVTTARTCVVAVTSSASSVSLVDPSSFGAAKILIKPVLPHVLLDAVSDCFGDHAPQQLYSVSHPGPTVPRTDPM
jgi:two-component system chemotaxis response regulator CheY